MPNANAYSSKINGIRFISDFINLSLAISSTAECEGQIVVTASNGQAPYLYSIDNGITFQTSNVFNNVCEGTYFVVVKDANSNRGRSIAQLWDQLDCGQYAGDTLQDVINDNIVLANVLNCTLEDFL